MAASKRQAVRMVEAQQIENNFDQLHIAARTLGGYRASAIRYQPDCRANWSRLSRSIMAVKSAYCRYGRAKFSGAKVDLMAELRETFYERVQEAERALRGLEFSRKVSVSAREQAMRGVQDAITRLYRDVDPANKNL